MTRSGLTFVVLGMLAMDRLAPSQTNVKTLGLFAVGGKASIELPHLTAANFESSLASDDLLTHYFNDFLSLPTFTESLLYNQETGQFEVVNGAAEVVSRRIRSVLHHSRSCLTGDPTMLARTPPIDNHFSVRCLDREQGIQWIMKERLPFFLQSDCYNEYRLAELFQQELNLFIQRRNKGGATSDCFSMSGDQTNGASTDGSFECKVYRRSADGGKDRLEGKTEKVHEDSKGIGLEENTNMFKKNWEVGSTCTDQENVLDICCHGTCCYGSRPSLDEFKEFLRGTPGEKVFNLWMDIERLKATQSRWWKNRYLVLMRSWYLLSSSHSSLNVELLSRLGLATSPCWTEEKLCSVQRLLTESLLCYWAPRFWTSQCAQEDRDDSSYVGLWSECCVSPLLGVQSHHGSITLPPLHPDNYQPQSSHTVHTQFYSSRSQSLDSRRDKMLQALSVDSWAGLYLTNICEQSGNQLWENAIYFWTDLQYYRELFYQDGLDPYRIQREAQLLFATYVFSSASRSIGVGEEIRGEVYKRMMPAFEELFDRVEEHTLNILQEPWTLLVNRDEESFQKVCVQEEVRRVDSQEYRELQSRYEESERRLKQAEQWGSMTSPSSDTPSTPADSWSRVSPKYRGYHLGSLLQHRHEIRHFMSFLKNHNASIHLTCWLDLEQYIRTSQKDTAVRKEGSTHIATKYLSEKYFFGSDSPATTEQQNNLLRMAGGLERLKLECLSNPIVEEIQDIVKRHIEKNWLPLFLSTAEFTERQKHRPKPRAANRPSQYAYRRRRARKDAWKDEGLWMSSIKDILLFRRILLNPITCVRFQHFVSLQDDFLENDLLFWVEVQRYKDLCHSHCDEATIQQKISTIINCFINSSTPPALQIDIPPEQAQNILEKRHELGPYIFREAQISVFGKLLNFWPEFQELSSSIQEEQLLPLLQKKKVKHRARVRRQRRKEEEEEEDERAQADLEVCFGEEEETDDEEGRSEITQPMSWSYSKYMAALRREEVLLRTRSQPDASFSTTSDFSDCSVLSAGSKLSRLQLSRRSSKVESKHYKWGVRDQHEETNG